MPTSYASLVEWNLHLSARRVARQVDGNAVDLDEANQQTLDATAGMIDTAAIEGGYAVPIIPADLTTNPDLAARITAMLVMKNIVMATTFLLQPIDETNKIEKARESCEEWLKQLAKGRGLPIVQANVEDSLGFLPGTGTRPFSPATLDALRTSVVTTSDGFRRRTF